MAPLSTLKELFLDEVQDLLNAERQLVKALPKMIHAATSVPLKDALAAHLTETETHVDRMELVLGILGATPRSGKCKGMEGILDEGAEKVDTVRMPALDAAIVSSGQRVEHHEICGYGVIHEWATTLGYDAAARLIATTLAEEKAASEKLAALAKGGINGAAAARDNATSIR
jgi:ferritin-like metal-binding protein YciE